MSKIYLLIPVSAVLMIINFIRMMVLDFTVTYAPDKKEV